MDFVIIPSVVPREPGMTRDDLFNINAVIVKTLCEGIAIKWCPNICVLHIKDSSNSHLTLL
jgi:malate dehydrogenase